MHYPVQFEAMTCFFSKDHRIWRTKVHYSNNFKPRSFCLFRDHCILRWKLHYLGRISSNNFFSKITLNLGQKSVLSKPNFMTRFWHTNCMTSLKGHRTPLVSLNKYFLQQKRVLNVCFLH